MVDWLAGKRIKGTSTERTASFIPSVGGWVELGRTTLGSANADITVSSLADKRYYMVLCNSLVTTNSAFVMKFNGDSGSNYASRRQENGGADATSVSRTNTILCDVTSKELFSVGYIANKSDKEKLMYTNAIAGNEIGAGTTPDRFESANKWANTSNAISSINLNNISTTNPTGSEMVVLGWDPADTHTTNFWTELSNVTLGADGDTLSSGTITAKKYLWGQAFIRTKTGVTTTDIRFNGDTGYNYSKRKSFAGGAEELSNSENRINVGGIDADNPSFINFFIINNSANEKLVMFHSVFSTPTGAGYAPYRIEGVGKWANILNQITEINFVNTGAGDYELGSKLIIWGSN